MGAKVDSYAVVWIDVKAYRPCRPSIKIDKLYHDFLQWSQDTSIHPIVRGFSGPLGWSGGYSAADAKAVLVWLREHGVEVG